MITRYLPTFKVFEVGTLVGLRNGHIISQQPAAATLAKKTVGEYSFIENGIIVGISNEGKVENFDKAKHTKAFVHYTEELNTYLDELKYYAVPVERKYDSVSGKEVDDMESTYPRCIALYEGTDAFCTNNVAADVEGAKYAKVVNGVLTLETEESDDSMFIVKDSTLPTGEKAYDFLFYRMPKVSA